MLTPHGESGVSEMERKSRILHLYLRRMRPEMGKSHMAESVSPNLSTHCHITLLQQLARSVQCS